MAKYFHIMHGLRGCYMPDSEPFVVMARTRRELKEVVAAEAEIVATDSTVGLTARAIANLAAVAWIEANKKTGQEYLPFCLPCKERGQSSYSYGIFVSVASRRDYLDYCKESES